jgi:hypothetical protein
MFKRLTRIAVLFSVAQMPVWAFGQTAISSAVAVSAERDVYDWITWAADPLLAAVGIGGIYVAIVTLGKIERQTKATEDAVKISQAALVSTFRPKLIIRSLRIYPDAATVDDVKRCRVGYDLVNIGGTVAHVVQREVCVHYNKGWGGEDVGNVSNAEESEKGFSLKPGEFREEFVELGTEVAQRLGHLEVRLAQGVNNPVMVGEIFHTGRVEYRDDTGATRRTAFHRSYNQETKRFSVVADSDYEYSD